MAGHICHPFHKAQDLTESVHQKPPATEGTVFKAPPMEDREEFVKFFSNLGHVMSCGACFLFFFNVFLTLLVHRLCEDHAPHNRCELTKVDVFHRSQVLGMMFKMRQKGHIAKNEYVPIWRWNGILMNLRTSIFRCVFVPISHITL